MNIRLIDRCIYQGKPLRSQLFHWQGISTFSSCRGDLVDALQVCSIIRSPKGGAHILATSLHNALLGLPHRGNHDHRTQPYRIPWVWWSWWWYRWRWWWWCQWRWDWHRRRNMRKLISIIVIDINARVVPLFYFVNATFFFFFLFLAARWTFLPIYQWYQWPRAKAANEISAHRTVSLEISWGTRKLVFFFTSESFHNLCSMDRLHIELQLSGLYTLVLKLYLYSIPFELVSYLWDSIRIWMCLVYYNLLLHSLVFRAAHIWFLTPM